MKLILLIALGSGIGGALRYVMSLLLHSKSASGFPLATLTVNLLGCFIIGLVYGLSDKGQLSTNWRLFLASGILGGFTTFSAFSLETMELLREGQLGYATTYITASVIFGVMATFLGYALLK